MALVLLLTYSGTMGGAERVLIEIAGALDGELCLVCPDGEVATAARAGGIRVLPSRARPLDLRASARDRVLAAVHLVAFAREARRLVRDLGPDLVIASGMRSALALLLGPGVGPPVVFQHSDMLPGDWIGHAVKFAAARADLVLVPSHAVAGELDDGARTVVVHPGVATERFDGTQPPAQPPEVLVLGALVGWKRPDLALEACAAVRRTCPDARLRFVGAPLGAGGDGLLAGLHERASREDLAGAVEFAGPVRDPRAELARASVLLHCAEREPFGIAVVEALASGRPAVVPASAGPAEIVDRSCGVLYPPGDSAGAAAAVLEVLSDPERAGRMGERGRARARTRFGAPEAREQIAEVIAPLLYERPASDVAAPALLTVTHNSAPELEALLASARRHLPGARVIVVDSASDDDTVAVARRAGAAQVIALEQNVGFGRACSRGLVEISEEITALVNPDVELLDDSLLALAAEAARRDRPERLLAPLVLSPDGSRQDSVHPRPVSAADLARALIPPAALPGRAGVAVSPWRAARPRAVGWAVGCALLARTETLRRIGPFDERIFMYGEDLDLGLAAAEHGVRTWFWPQGRVLHHGAHSTHTAFGGEPFERLAQARHDVVLRRLGPRRARADRAAQALTFASRIALKRALGHGAARERRQLAALARVRQE